MCDCYTRREFVGRGLGLIGLGCTAPSFLARTVFALDGPQDAPRAPRAGGGDERVLVVLQLAGGNDGLNTIIPYRNDDYYRHRPKLAVEGGKMHRIDDDFAFHPSADGLKALYEDGILAVVHGVGYPNPSRSHFVGTEIWETADPNQRNTTGWVGRYFDAQCRGADPPDPKVGVALVKESPTSMIGSRFTPLTFTSPDQLDWRPDRSNKDARRTFDLINQPREEAGAAASRAGAGAAAPTNPAAVSTLDYLRRAALDARVDVEAVRAAIGDEGGADRRSTLEHELGMVARMIAAGLPTRVYYVSLSGFDTHANQSGRHATLLKQLGDGLTAFTREVKSHRIEDRVLLMTFSEFGRRVTQNASGGTDHGKAAPLLLVGSPVAAGLHGRHPGLRADQLDRGDLQHTTDFRSVYATVLREWLAADARDILGGDFASLPLLKTRGAAAIARPGRNR